MSTNCKTFISRLQSLNLLGYKVTANYLLKTIKKHMGKHKVKSKRVRKSQELSDEQKKFVIDNALSMSKKDMGIHLKVWINIITKFMKEENIKGKYHNKGVHHTIEAKEQRVSVIKEDIPIKEEPRQHYNFDDGRGMFDVNKFGGLYKH